MMRDLPLVEHNKVSAPSPENPPIRILLVDDEEPHRELLKEIFDSPEQFIVDEAADGFQALNQIAANTYDVLLLDYNMPKMTGLELCQKIRQMPGWERVPIIMVTANNRPTNLQHAFFSGVTDFVGKPYSPLELETRVRACSERYRLHLALVKTTGELLDARKMLEISNERLLQERNTIERIIHKMRSNGLEQETGFRYISSPLEKTSGDILLSSHTPSHKWHVLVGDFMGHGLPAAAGSPTVSYIFQSMSQRDVPMEQIVHEINLQIHRLFPTGLYMAGCFLEFSACRTQLKVWNGGLPAPYLMRGQTTMERIPSLCLPFGILPDGCQDCYQVYSLQTDDTLYIVTDGVIESSNEAGELIGEHYLEEILLSDSVENKIHEIMKRVNDFSGSSQKGDDMTVVEIIINSHRG